MGTLSYKTTIESRFNTSWANATPVCFDNVPFSQPSAAPWVKVEVWDGDVAPAVLGSGPKMRRYSGTVFVSIYVPKNTTTTGTRDYVDDVVAIFRDRQENGITFYEPKIKRIGEQYQSGAGSAITSTVASIGWFTQVVAIPFKYDEIV